MANGAILGQTANTYSKEQIMDSTIPPLYGLGSDAVPSDVLKVLSRFHAGLGNEYLWAKFKDEDTYTSSKFTESVFTAVNGSFIRHYMMVGDSLSLTPISGGMAFTLSNLKTVLFNAAFSQANASQLLGKYVYMSSNDPTMNNVEDLSNQYSNVYFIPETATLTVDNSGGQNKLLVSEYFLYANPKIEPILQGYVNSPDPSAYPPSVSDGYTYTPLGQLGNKVRIATGSYAGTDTFGFENQNSLDFDFEPQVVFISSEKQNDESRIAILVRGSDRGIRFQNLRSNDSIDGVIYGVAATWESKTVHWYNYEGADEQMNKSGITYRYRAWGV